jgi:hypothetical protein
LCYVAVELDVCNGIALQILCHPVHCPLVDVGSVCNQKYVNLLVKLFILFMIRCIAGLKSYIYIMQIMGKTYDSD